MDVIKKEIDLLEKTTDVLSLSTCYITEDFINMPLISEGTKRWICRGFKSVNTIFELIEEKQNCGEGVLKNDNPDGLLLTEMLSDECVSELKNIERKVNDDDVAVIDDPLEIYDISERSVSCFSQICNSLKSWLGNAGVCCPN